MTTSNRFSIVSRRLILIAGVAASGVFAMALPTLAQAATYAYVNQSMEVRTVTADDWMSALRTAPNIHVNSGVMLLTAQNSSVVGTSI